MVAISIILGYALNFTFPQFEPSCPWFLGCFAMGMAGAVLNFSIIDFHVKPYAIKILYLNRIKQIVVALAFLCFVLTVLKIDVTPPRVLPSHLYIADTLIGITTTAILVFFTYHLQIQRSEPQRTIKKPALLQLFETSISLKLGVFSYSLYLIHDPIFYVMQFLTTKYQIGVASRYAIMMGMGMPLALGVAYLFYCMIERPLLNLRSSQKSWDIKASESNLK